MADEVDSGRSAPRDGAGGRNLPLAIAVGVVLAGMLIGSVLWHPLAFTVVVGLLATVGLFEASRVLAGQGWPTALPVLLVTMVVMLAGGYRAGASGQAVGVLVLFGGGVAWELAAHDRREVWRTLAATTFLGLWVCFLASYAVLLVAGPDGVVAVFAVAGGAIFGDIGGYAFGTLLGRTPVAPSVSPRKTWEGLIGGLLLTAVIAWFVLPMLSDLFADPVTGVVVAVSSAIAGFFGDLTESMVKRDLGVKDLGDVLPGHGGVLDRVDGILLALPVGYYALVLLT